MLLALDIINKVDYKQPFSAGLCKQMNQGYNYLRKKAAVTKNFVVSSCENNINYTNKIQYQ